MKTNCISSKSETFLDTAIFIGGHWNFGHWLFNHVARFCFLEEGLKQDTTFLVPSSLNAKQLEILSTFTLATQIKSKSGTIVNVGPLVPQMPWHSISDFAHGGLLVYSENCENSFFDSSFN